MEKILNYIGGELVSPVKGQFLPNENPATGQVYSELPHSSVEDVERAVQAASLAFPQWSQTSVEKRSDFILKLAKLLEKNLKKFALAESIDSGKTIQMTTTVDVPRSQRNLEFFAQEILKFKGETFSPQGLGYNELSYAPLGVVAIISPWNFPLHLFTWKIAPALVTGNTVVAKPSEITPMTAYLFSQLCIEAGLPPGVLNVVHGLGSTVGESLCTQTNIKAISFTGSTVTGKKIAQYGAQGMKKVSLEMGGKNPNIIFADCNFDETLKTTLRSSFSNQGQICLCGSRIFIQKPLYEKFKLALIQETKKLKPGNPLDSTTEQGAVVSKGQYEKILSYLQLAQAEGGKILVGGSAAKLDGENKNGYFIQPTLIEGLSCSTRTNQEEIFGPVATLIPFETEAEVIAMANSTSYGLSASIWSEDEEKAKRVAQQIESGVVWINTWNMRDLRTPFGGMKSSGLGREGGEYGLKFFTEVKNICINK